MALIKLRFAELGFRQIKRKYILYYTTLYHYIIQSECGKTRTRIIPNMDTFDVVLLSRWILVETSFLSIVQYQLSANQKKKTRQTLTLLVDISKQSTGLYFYSLIEVLPYSFVLFPMFLFSRFVFESFIFIWVFDFSKYLILFENSCWCHCVDIFCTEFKFYEPSTVINSVVIILSIETLYNFRTTKCWYTLYHKCTLKVSANSNVFYF